MIEINSKDLEIGMYVARLDRPWIETSFLFQGFRIENKSQIEQLQRLCKTVNIDEEKSAPSLSFEAFKPSVTKPGAPSLSLEASKPPVTKPGATQHSSPRKVTQSHKKRFEEEMAAARDVYENTSISLNKVLNDFRLNNYIAIPEVNSCVQAVIRNVKHNPNALVLLSNLRSKRQGTITHSINVCIFATLFGRYLAFNNEQLSQLSVAALLHDVGEARLPKTILDKHNKGLTPEERAIMEMHTRYGAEMLRKIAEIPDEAAEVAHSHHERMDGNGYPRGLKGAEISLVSRIIAIIDEYERITNNADPKMQISCSEALKSIYAMRDTFFDGELVESFIKCLGIYPVGSVVQLNNGAIGIVIAMKPDKHLLPTVMIIRDSAGEIRRPPQVINLDNFRDHDGEPFLLINKVIDTNAVGIDLSDYIVKELGIRVNSAAKRV